MQTVSEPEHRAWEEDGVICLRNALSPETLACAREAFDWSMANPGPNADETVKPDGGHYYQDRANPAAMSVYEPLARRPEFKDILTQLWNCEDVWFLFEQVFSRIGGECHPTPWHQDTPYMPTRGSHLATVWFSFEPVPKETALELVAGSHKGALYNGNKSHPDEEPGALYDHRQAALIPLPDIDNERDKWNLRSWDTRPGDLLVFHPSVLHGGGGTVKGGSRQTVTLRFFGNDVIVADLEDVGVYRGSRSKRDPLYHPLIYMYHEKPGAAFRNPDFPKL